MSNPLLRLHRVSKRFGGVSALSDVSCNVQQGAIVGIIGPNGAGKTTLFNVITGAYQVSEGEIRLRDDVISNLPPHRIARAGVVRTFQNIRLFRSMSVWEHLLVAQTGSGAWFSRFAPIWPSKTAVNSRAEHALAFFGLEQVRDQLAGSLPYGIQRKVEMARALVAEPKLLLLDEPAAGLNHRETEELGLLVRRLSQGGMTILLIEHDMKFVMGLCDDIYVLDFGVMIAHGKPDAIQMDAAVLDAYLGQA
jgi:branched-chain amino acid transport system ATP-binding protein